MATKFFLVYGKLRDECKNEYRKETFTKSDMYWFGLDEKIALQKFRSFARSGNSTYTTHIKCLDLDAIPDYIGKSNVDEQINTINKEVFGKLLYRVRTRMTNNKDGVVTVAVSLDETQEASPNHYGNSNISVVHNSKVSCYHITEEAFNSVFEIILDRYMKGIDIIAPVKVNINGKLYKKYKPTNEN